MSRRAGVMIAGWVLAAACAVSADHGMPTTRPVQAAEPDLSGSGESTPVEVEKDGYKAKLSWFPAAPKPGDLVRYRLLVTGPGGTTPTLLMRAGILKTAPGNPEDLRPKEEVPAEATPQDGRFVFSQVIYVAGTYQVGLQFDDLEAGKSVKLDFPPATIGSPASNAAVYGVGIGGLALVVIVIAFGLRRPAAE
ncbi:MAG: hypothetical protein K8T20_20640 [Planctomycetes bacterium]|nr:hypothetical protein [Planctomycetota bacterium]